MSRRKRQNFWIIPTISFLVIWFSLLIITSSLKQPKFLQSTAAKINRNNSTVSGWIPIDLISYGQRVSQELETIKKAAAISKNKGETEELKNQVRLYEIYLEEFRLMDINRDNKIDDKEFSSRSANVGSRTYSLKHTKIKNLKEGLYYPSLKPIVPGKSLGQNQTNNQELIIIVEAGIYPQIQDSLNQYISDINSSYQGTVVLCNGCAREEIKNIFLTTPLLVGGLFVGDLPVAWGRQQDYVFPVDRYYTDLDGDWSQERLCYDGHPELGMCLIPPYAYNVDPEIFLGRINPPLFQTTPKIQLINGYFQKNHNYRLGLSSLQNRALIYLDDDWVPGSPGGLDLIYPNYNLIQDPVVTNAQDYISRFDDSYEYLRVNVHSNTLYHYFASPGGGETTVSYEDVRDTHPNFFFYELNACSSGNFVYQNYLAGWYVFQESDYGLIAIATTKPGLSAWLTSYYQTLLAGGDIGTAFTVWLNIPAHARRADFMGLSLIGDPTLRIQSIPPPPTSTPTLIPTPTPTPTCIPRPPCLNLRPRPCLIPEPIDGWCKPTPTPTQTYDSSRR